MAKSVKKVDVKKVEKLKVSELIKNSFDTNEVYEILEGEDFGFTEGTIVLRTKTCDIQVKLITPKAGITHYEAIEVEVAETTETK